MTGTASDTTYNISPYRVFLVLALLAATFFALQGVSGTVRTPIKQSPAKFPTSLGEWKVISSRASTEAVMQMLGVDDYVEYNYTNPTGQPLNFYAAYYESVGTGEGYHSPKNCIPSGGWGIDSAKTVEIQPSGSRSPVKVSAMIPESVKKHQQKSSGFPVNALKFL